MSEPPPYDKSAYGQGFTAPGQGFAAPGQGFTAPGENRVMYVAPPTFGEQAVTTVCRNCQANITTSTSSETGTIAWISAGVLCVIGFWCCFWIPLTMDSLKDVTHKCPNCNAVVGKYKSKM
eukprot:TRINITY_DN37690_c0_g1_i1.p1 TRINITY_DN37690_c0_g1~~TRINITY_DN37690_c0_g1_i1.p1  ORF type:complete len:131 (+),score=37.67 TRINITY_DN37690_c0_g1_i1:32-394(+)